MTRAPLKKSRSVPYLDRSLSTGELVTASASTFGASAPEPDPPPPEPLPQPLSEADAIEEAKRRGE
jgi:hypothetical protein